MVSRDTTVLTERKVAARPAIDGVRLAKNSTFNFAGQILPLLAGIALIPYIVRGLGPDRFGILGIIWVVFGYFSLMDLGLGRATTKFLAEWLAQGETSRISDMVWISVLLQVLLGVAGGLLIATFTPVLLVNVLKTHGPLLSEARTSCYILAAALPVVLVSSSLRAVLEGCQRFDITNLLRIPSSILMFAIPAAGVAVGLQLPGIVLLMAIFRLVFAIAHGSYCLRVLPSLKTMPSLGSKVVFRLLSFGGWVTASNLVNPILLSMDRFLLGALVSVAMVGYYTAPFEAVTKLWLIPTALMTTVYPACSAMGSDRMCAVQGLYSRSIKYIFCGLAPIILVLILFARPIIGAWLGPAFVDISAVPLQLLALGVFFNCFAHVPYCFMQALGKPDAPAKLFLCELPLYALFAWWMIERHGIVGAAAAWSARVVIEVLLLLWIARREFSLSAINVKDRRMWTALGALFATAVATCTTDFFFHQAIIVDVSLCGIWIAGFGLTVWKWVFDETDRVSALAAVAPFRAMLGKSILQTQAGASE
jgi:O-antigen/teichoic acid export membrane protein